MNSFEYISMGNYKYTRVPNIIVFFYNIITVKQI